MSETNDLQIVLIEDSPDDAELTMRSIKRSNQIKDVVWLRDGEEAVHFMYGLGKYHDRDITIIPKLILLDLKLPKLSGTEVLEKIKKDETYRNIPVVIMTSSKENSDLNRCYALGANSYVVKPIDFSQFMKVTNDISLYWVLINQLPKN